MNIRSGGIETCFYNKRSICLDGALELYLELIELDDLDGAAFDQLKLFINIFFHDLYFTSAVTAMSI